MFRECFLHYVVGIDRFISISNNGYIYNQVSCLGSGIPSLVGGLGSKVHLSVMEDGLYL